MDGWREVEEGGGRGKKVAGGGNDMIGRNGTPDVNISLPRA